MIPFLQLTPGEDAPRVRAAIDRVLSRGWFILGPELEAFEQEFATACGMGHSVGVGTGTDAIAIALRALGIGPGDEVITSPLSAAFSALAIMMAGARPVFVDIDEDRLTIDPRAIAAAITPSTAAIMPVHLYGQPADMTAIVEIASRHNLAIVEDCCQSHLATCDGKPVGSFGAAAAFSFYPTKNLGALGDGGAIVTNDPALAARAARFRNGGQAERYEHREPGVNSRLDEIQAAILRERLTLLPAWTDRRRTLAAEYRAALRDVTDGARAARARSRARLPSLSCPQHGTRGDASAPAVCGHRDADSLSDTDPATTSTGRRTPCRLPGDDEGVRRDLLASPLSVAR